MTSDTPDPAHILFPNDAPPKAPPESFIVQHAQAEARLLGSQKKDDPAASSPAEKDKPDAASVLFKEDAAKAAEFDGKVMTEFAQGFALSALSDGDLDRSRAINAAGEALAEDFRTAGTATADASEALAIVKDRMSAIGGPSLESIAAEYETSIAAVRDEGISDAELNAARTMIRDMEIVAPGTIATLERSGAGNDLKLIRKAVSEAKRRGYR